VALAAPNGHRLRQRWLLIQQLFDQTDRLDPIFNPLDANNPNTMDASTVEGRRAAYSMMLSKGVFRRGGTPRPNSEWEIIAAEDPNGSASRAAVIDATARSIKRGHPWAKRARRRKAG
jgi:hypothetical protein